MAKDNFIQMKHWVFDALAMIKMTDGERRVMICIIRYTVGFRRYEAKLSSRFIAEYTGMSIANVHKCIKHLTEIGYITIQSPGTGTRAQVIHFNSKVFSVHFRDASVHFQNTQRSLSSDLAFTSDQSSVHQLVNKERKRESKEEIKKKKENFFSSKSRRYD